ncbi:hypothetical protein AB595_22015 [Massilia sp. WF1]|uniref:flagellin n=1 Tax=unclassified Massilia TaxID=2609279 RepID=UPI000649D9A4|nr:MULTISPECIES: flagellin [unclassified Massilia]ALK96176.1 hypothetical protein AM586_07680 [Massilia sp. WG5]KLU34762.1 hypothetical protein AB595_22015 [Massilia sp. WF1]
MSLSINNNSLSLNAQRRLAEHTADVSQAIAKMNSGARIDGTSSTVKLTRAQILQQAASAMLTQANGQASAVLALLR